MSSLMRPLIRHGMALAFVASAVMLAIAHAFQTFGGLAPCTLCLEQRQVYWVALAVAGIGLIAARSRLGARLRPLVLGLLAVIFLVGAGIAVYHAGAEWKWWPGPTACSSGGGGASAAALAELMHGARIKAPRCDQAAWVMMGLSMAGWNAIASVVFAAFSAAAALQRPSHG